MSVRLTLICHASTDAVRNAAFPADEPLDAQGRQAATACARTLRRIDDAWTSPALRARQTAVALGLNAKVDAALRDIELGTWAGQTLDAVQAADPAGIAAWSSDAGAKPHGGESIADLLARVDGWLGTLAQASGRVVVVTHAAVIRAAIIVALDASPLSFWRIDVTPLCRVDFNGRAGGRTGGVWTLRSLSLGAFK